MVVKAVVSCPPCCPPVELRRTQIKHEYEYKYKYNTMSAPKNKILDDLDAREYTGKLADQGTASPKSSGLVEERRDLGGSSSVSSGETE
jgi:hypothetical protein